MTRPRAPRKKYGKDKKTRMPGVSGERKKQERAAFIHALTSKGIDYNEAMQRWERKQK